MPTTAVPPAPPIQRLAIREAFDGLAPRERLYAHHMARYGRNYIVREKMKPAAWHGTRVILRQVSPEAEGIFDFILALHASCAGRWETLVEDGLVSKDECEAFLGYAATFLSNVGNFYGSGDQKFTPDLSVEALEKLAGRTGALATLWEGIRHSISVVPPHGLGYPGALSQSAYYPDDGLPITAEEVAAVSRALEERGLYPENTRIRKVSKANCNEDDHASSRPTYEILVASVETDAADSSAAPGFPAPFTLAGPTGGTVKIVRGDHSAALARICASLDEASRHARNDLQRDLLAHHARSLRTGDLVAYRDGQRLWVRDRSPRVETILGFVEPYRDPHGARAEFEGVVAIADERETALLLRLVARSDDFVRRLPWAVAGENGGKGPFEKALFEPPDFASIHSLAYCSSILFPGINLPNYNDIRQEVGFKNVIIANRMAVESRDAAPSPFIEAAEAEVFGAHRFAGYYLWVVLHELLGHGTGKLLREESTGVFNFDAATPPVDPLTGRPVRSWYGPGQTWTGLFGDLATTVDECRAELVGAYLMDDEELLGMFGYGEDTEITASDLTYNLYQQLAVDGLRGLANFNAENGTWGQAHSRAHFAILKCILTDTGGDFLTVAFEPLLQRLTVHVDRAKIRSHGKPALGRMLLRLHMYRSTADAAACRAYYEDLSRVDDADEAMPFLRWREVVLAHRPPRRVFVQPNTFLQPAAAAGVAPAVVLREYEATTRGVIQSWAERAV